MDAMIHRRWAIGPTGKRIDPLGTDLIESYNDGTLNSAIHDLIQMGWEEDGITLLTSPILIWGDKNELLATITYSPDPGDLEHPLLHAHVIADESLRTYRAVYGSTEDGEGYTAVLIAR